LNGANLQFPGAFGISNDSATADVNLARNIWIVGFAKCGSLYLVRTLCVLFIEWVDIAESVYKGKFVTESLVAVLKELYLKQFSQLTSYNTPAGFQDVARRRT
jgi:hypothetical protein